MLASTAPLAAQPARLAAPRRQQRVVVAQAAAAPAQEPRHECPLLQEAAVCGKSSCVHPGRPVGNACADCPRRARSMAMAKKKCVHPDRPISAACADCPRRK